MFNNFPQKTMLYFGFILIFIFVFTSAGNSASTMGIAMQDLNGTVTSDTNFTVWIYDAGTGGNLVFQDWFTNVVNGRAVTITLGDTNKGKNPLDLNYGQIYWMDINAGTSNLDFNGMNMKMFVSNVGDINNAINFNNLYLKTNGTNNMAGDFNLAGNGVISGNADANIGFYAGATGDLRFQIRSDGTVAVRDTFAITTEDYLNPVTDLFPANTIGYFGKDFGGGGNPLFAGISDGTETGLHIVPIIGANNAEGIPALTITPLKSDGGTGAEDLNTDDTAFSISNLAGDSIIEMGRSYIKINSFESDEAQELNLTDDLDNSSWLLHRSSDEGSHFEIGSDAGDLIITNESADGNIFLGTGGKGESYSRVIITPDGNVGIGIPLSVPELLTLNGRMAMIPSPLPIISAFGTTYVDIADNHLKYMEPTTGTIYDLTETDGASLWTQGVSGIYNNEWDTNTVGIGTNMPDGDNTVLDVNVNRGLMRLFNFDQTDETKLYFDNGNNSGAITLTGFEFAAPYLAGRFAVIASADSNGLVLLAQGDGNTDFYTGGYAADDLRMSISSTGTLKLTPNLAEHPANFIAIDENGITFHREGNNGFSLSGGYVLGDENSLFINNGAPLGDMVFKTNNAERMRILNSGYVGIGLSNPAGLVHLSSPSANLLLQSNSNTISEANIGFMKGRGTQASPLIVEDGDYLGTINFQGHDGVTYLSGAQIQAIINGTPGANDLPTDLLFLTSPDGSVTPLERMRIKSSGIVAIGTISDSDKYILDINTNVGDVRIFNYDTTKEAKLTFDNGFNNGSITLTGYEFDAPYIAGKLVMVADNDTNGLALISQADGNIDFYTGGFDENNLRMRITYDGNVGFNSNHPQAVVDINAMLRLEPVSAPPKTCNGSMMGSIYVDVDVNAPCFCTGTEWLELSNMTVGCS